MALGTKRKASNILSKQPLDLPPGTIHAFAGTTAPEGWMICDGTAISRTDYAGLFAAIGELWGNGDGSTTFNLPDLEGRFLRGADNSSGIDPDAGSRVPLGNGIADGVGSLQNNATAKNGLTASQAGHRHIEGQTSSVNDSRWFKYGLSSETANSYTTGSSGSGKYPYTQTVTPSITVGNGDVETRPTNCSVNYIIKL